MLLTLRQEEIIRTPRQIRGSYYSFLTIISASESNYENFSVKPGENNRSVFSMSKTKYGCKKRQRHNFLMSITIKILLRFFAFRLCRCSTVKSGSQREKLLLKTFILPRVELYFEFGSLFIYATFFPWSLTSGFATLTRTLFLLFSVLPRLCRKANKKTEVNPNEKSSLFHKKSQR